MKTLEARRVADLSGGRMVRGPADRTVLSVSTDTRQIGEGALFVALVGDRFDGHDFLANAVKAGASALLVDRLPGDSLSADDQTACIQVPDTLVGLQHLAKAYRRLLETRAVVITGSNGKTSTKDMIRGVLGFRHSVKATLGNLNNHIGLPLTVLRTDPDDDFGVWEIGMNHPGEIAPLADIAGPNIAVITNIGTAHIGNMESQEAIALEKGRLAEALSSEGLLVLNADDRFTSSLRKRTASRVVTVGIDAGDLRARHLDMQADHTIFQLAHASETALVRLPVPGRHMVSNALLAAAVGREAGLSLPEIAEALGQVELTPGRLQALRKGGFQWINDAYNANPDSMRAALSTVGTMRIAGKKCVLLGAMGELGDSSLDAHREIGRFALEQDFAHIASVGEPARAFTEGLKPGFGQAVHHFTDHAAAATFLRETAAPGDLVLLKGSRAAAMDQVYQLFVDLSA